MSTIQPLEPKNHHTRLVAGSGAEHPESRVDWESRRRGWEETRAHIEEFVPEVAYMLRTGSLSRRPVSTRSLFGPRVWKLSIQWSDGDRYDPVMRLALRKSGDWALLGAHPKGHAALVDPYARFMPGVGQGYVLDEYGCAANVVFGFTERRIQRILLSQVG